MPQVLKAIPGRNFHPSGPCQLAAIAGKHIADVDLGEGMTSCDYGLIILGFAIAPPLVV